MRPALCLTLLAVAMMPFSTIAQRDETFEQETANFAIGQEPFENTRVVAVGILPGGPSVAATRENIYLLDNGKWEAGPEPPFDVAFLAVSSEALYVASASTVAEMRFDANRWTSFPVPDKRVITCLFAAHRSSGLLAGTDKGLCTLDDGRLIPVPGPSEPVLSVAHGPQGELAIGAKSGLYVYNVGGGGQWNPVYPSDGNRRWAPYDVRGIAYNTEGALVAAMPQGVAVRWEDQWALFSGSEGLPWNGFINAAAGPGGSVWFATDRGAIRFEGGDFDYYFSRRWLPHDQVNHVAIDSQGAALAATEGGLARIERHRITLDGKSDYFLAQTEARHVRDGFVADCALEERYDASTHRPKISDNDGMYTAMYGAAEAFRFAATGEDGARKRAMRCFEACARLVDITGTGMPARVIIPKDWHEPVNEQYGEAYNEKRRETDPFWKLITPRFVESEDGEYLWKCDTSSDELAGHYFFYGIYYDLVVNKEEEREEVRRVVRLVTDHLVDNGFLLRDHDGEPTRWGNFSPEFLNSPRGWEQRGLNAMMMLSFLAVAKHITGDAKYDDAARLLRDEHQYHIHAMQSKMFYPPDYVVPWDNNLCLLSWYGLLRYEEDPELVLMWRLSLEHAWRHVSKQKNALWNLLYAACAQEFAKQAKRGRFDGAYPELGPYAEYGVRMFNSFDARMKDTMETLRGIPLDLIGYHMDNTHRLDVVNDPTPGAPPDQGWHFDGRALPIEERGHVRQDRDAFALDLAEGDGWSEHEGTFFLLPYWLGVHHGFID